MNIGKIVPAEIVEEMQKSYLDYAMSVIVARALPDVRDGLKPVHRRILYAMWQNQMRPENSFRKSAAVVGEVLKSYHPHGDMPVYDALVRMAQEFSMRYPLVRGQGNFGSVDGDPPAAMRYTEVKLASISTSLLTDIEKDTVRFSDNFDSTTKEPDYMPALLPNLLLMGSEGIAVGMATKIPPHNLSEVVDAVIATIGKGKVIIEDQKKVDESFEFAMGMINKVAAGEIEYLDVNEVAFKNIGFESEITIEELVEIMPGPDFPTGGAIYGGKNMVEVYSTGRGRINVRGIAEIVENSKGKSQILITEIPYQVNKANLVKKIADLVRDKKITGIADLRDESDKAGMTIAIDLKRDSKPKSILNNLYKHTALQTTFPANFVALVDGTPYTLGLKQILLEYIKHRQDVIVRRSLFELAEAKRRSHILEGYKIALDNLDEVIKTIRESKTQEDAKVNLIAKFGFSGIQATAILDMQLRRLAALEREKIEKEYQEIMKLIDKLIAILKNPKKVLEIIVKEITELKEKYGDARRTRIYKKDVEDFSEEDLIPNKKTLITLTHTGYVKRVPLNTYKTQGRGGKGVAGMAVKESDEIEHLISAMTHDTILFFTNKGKVFGTRAWDIAESARTAKGQAVVNIIDIGGDERVMSILPLRAESKHLIMVTAKGVIKKTAVKEFQALRASGLIAIRLEGSDQLVSVHETSGEDHILMLTKNGKSIRFPEANVRPMGRATSGMRGMKLGAEDEVIGMEVFHPKSAKELNLLIISEKGMGKRTNLDLFPVQKRAGSGVKASVVSTKTGPVAAESMVVQTTEEVIITSKNGQVIKLPINNVPQMGRATQGVILMRFAKAGDAVAAVASLDLDIDAEEETVDNNES